MKIYVAYSNSFDFKTELYEPITASELVSKHEFIFPHSKSDKPYNSKDLILGKECDLVLAEVSYASTGLGIEIGWANVAEIPVICISKKGSKVSQSLSVVSSKFVEYEDSSDLVEKLINYLP